MHEIGLIAIAIGGIVAGVRKWIKKRRDSKN